MEYLTWSCLDIKPKPTTNLLSQLLTILISIHGDYLLRINNEKIY
jgi:hypothetical protein